jgi:hypothetical protein
MKKVMAIKRFHAGTPSPRGRSVIAAGRPAVIIGLGPGIVRRVRFPLVPRLIRFRAKGPPAPAAIQQSNITMGHGDPPTIGAIEIPHPWRPGVIPAAGLALRAYQDGDELTAGMPAAGPFVAAPLAHAPKPPVREIFRDGGHLLAPLGDKAELAAKDIDGFLINGTKSGPGHRLAIGIPKGGHPMGGGDGHKVALGGSNL